MTPVAQSPQASPLPPQAQALLEQMHDIVAPGPVSWWPPAPGWWILAVLLVAVVIGVTAAVRERRRRNAYKRTALTILDTLNDCPDQDLPRETNRLLKRVALVAFPSHRTVINQAFGEGWVMWLNQRCPQPVFNGASATALAQGGYRSDLSCPRDELLTATQQWLLEHRRSTLSVELSDGRPARV